MNNVKDGISRYHLGEKLLIGYRDDHTLFWLRNDKDYWDPKTDELKVLDAGKAWIDKKSDTTILDFPITDDDEIHRLKNEYIKRNSNDWILHYRETDYYVQLTECSRFNPMKNRTQSKYYSYANIDHDYELPAYMEGYILDEDIFLRKNNQTGDLYYIKFTEFSKNDIENDRFGWVKAAREFFSISSDEELLSELECYRKESYGNAWIDEKNDVVVLGPVYEQKPEILDNYFADRICTYSSIYSEWNKTKSWTDVESGLKSNPFNWKVEYFFLTEKYMG